MRDMEITMPIRKIKFSQLEVRVNFNVSFYLLSLSNLTSSRPGSVDFRIASY